MRYQRLVTPALLALPASTTAHSGPYDSTSTISVLMHMLSEHAPMALLLMLITVALVAAVRRVVGINDREDSA